MSYHCELRDETAQPTLAVRCKTTYHKLPKTIGDGFAMLKQQMAELHRHAGGWTGRSRQACGSEICLGAGKRRLLKHVMLPKRVR